MDQDRSLDSEGIPDLEGPLPEKVATGDPQEGVSPPADHPASLEWGTTAEEQREGEPLDVRISHEEPEVWDDEDPVDLVAEDLRLRDADADPDPEA